MQFVWNLVGSLKLSSYIIVYINNKTIKVMSKQDLIDRLVKCELVIRHSKQEFVREQTKHMWSIFDNKLQALNQ